MGNFKNMRYKPVEQCTKSLKKNGKLKGKNKKQTKMLKAICTHHKYNHKGRLVSKIFNNGDGTCHCRMCGATFTTKHAKNKKEINSNLKPFKNMLNQLKYTIVACGLGAKSLDYACNLAASVEQFPKVYGKAMAVAKKKDDLGNKNKKKNNSRGGSSQYGSWGYK